MAKCYPCHETVPAACTPQIAFPYLPSTIFNSSGGIAQLVERQLCKLEVRGSNPLASKIKLMVES